LLILNNLRAIFQQWGGKTAAFFAYTHASHDLCPALLGPLLPLIRAEFGLTYLQSGLLLSAYSITSGLSQLPGGWLGDRFSRHTVVALGLVGVSLTAIAVGLSSSYYPLLIILVIMGIFTGAYHPSAVPMLSDRFEAGRRGKVMGLHMVGGTFGFSLGPILGGLIADQLGWHFAFIILGVPALVAAPLAFRIFKRQERDKIVEPTSPISRDYDTQVNEAPLHTGISQVIRAVAIIVTLSFLTQFTVGAAIAFLPIYLVDKHSITPASAALLIGLLRGAGVIGSLLGGWLSDRLGRRNAIALVLVSSGPVFYLLTQLPFNWFFILVLAVLGMVGLMRQSTVQPFLMDNTPPHLRATIFGIYFGLTMEGMSLIQPVAGHFMDVYGIVDVFHFISLLSIALSLVALLVIRPRLRRGAMH